MELETGDTADYRTTSEGIELEVLDAEEKRLAMLYFRWDEVAPLLRGLYARQLDGFGQEPVSYTHLTRPTNREGGSSWGHATTNKKTKQY